MERLGSQVRPVRPPATDDHRDEQDVSRMCTGCEQDSRGQRHHHIAFNAFNHKSSHHQQVPTLTCLNKSRATFEGINSKEVSLHYTHYSQYWSLLLWSLNKHAGIIFQWHPCRVLLILGQYLFSGKSKNISFFKSQLFGKLAGVLDLWTSGLSIDFWNMTLVPLV